MQTRNLVRCVFILSTLLIADCGRGRKHDDSPDGNNNAPPTPPNEQPTPPPLTDPPAKLTLEKVQTEIVNVQCLPCHAAARRSNHFVELKDLSKVIVQDPPVPGDKIKKVIVPGCPEDSSFYLVMKEKEMPPSPRDPVTEANLAVVEKWIKSLGNANTRCSAE